MSLTKIDPQTLVGLACHIGAVEAIEFAEFAKSLEELAPEQKKLLLRGYLAIAYLPSDASLERGDLLCCLRALRQAWITLKYSRSEFQGTL